MENFRLGSTGRLLGRLKFCRAGSASKILYVFALWACLAFNGFSAPSFDTQNPLVFFTNVSSRLVMDGLNLDLSRLQVYPTNQYTPAVQRLLQVTANIYQATTTNVFPVVFRPVFSSDEAGTAVFISGYEQVVSVSGTGDAQLANPLEAVALIGGQTPFTNRAVNVYGIPWIIAAKKGLPNFNQFYLRNTFGITRKLQVYRFDPNQPGALGTNQMFVMSITNRLGFSFWNSYEDNYVPVSGSMTVYFRDVLRMGLTNDLGAFPEFSGGYNPAVVQFAFITNLVVWPGSAWSDSGPVKPFQTANPNSFVFGYWDYPFLTESIYRMSLTNFVPVVGATWETGLGYVSPLPHFGLATTNCIQAYILDGTNVIDYVQLNGPSSQRDLNSEINDPNYSGSTSLYMWSTNGYGDPFGPQFGVVNQLLASRFAPAGTIASFWKKTPEMPAIFNTPQLEASYFNAFFTGAPIVVGGKVYINTNLVLQAPYTPSRTSWEYTSWQANDPLVHYLVNDLNCVMNITGVHRADDLVASEFPNPYLNSIGNHYQSWGRNNQMAQYSYVDSSAYNSRLRDPLVWGSDDWNFPVGQSWNLNWLGRVHRGTPWQTIYLKSQDVLDEMSGLVNIGTNTWQTWFGVTSPTETQLTSPTSDRHLASLLAVILNTNDLRSQFSVNNPDANAWAALMDGFTALTNTTEVPGSYGTPTFASLVVSSNSPQMASIISAIQAIHPGQPFQEIGELLAVPDLSTGSPYLNWFNTDQQQYGITDEAYEIIPSQLLPLLRADSIGYLTVTNNQCRVQFTGYDEHSYVIETSSDLKEWTPISTNFPVKGSLQLDLLHSDAQRFYRSVLKE